MNNQYLSFIKLLEEALASFYDNLIKQPHLERIKSVLEFMSTHSAEHADRIKEVDSKYIKPSLDDNTILSYQNDLNQKISQQLNEEKDLANILDILAESEESLGKLYQNVSKTIADLGNYYLAVSKEIDGLARDEFNHRDILLNDKKNLHKR